MNKKIAYEIFRRFQENKPNPKIELDYKDPYTLLVAVVLSAQATDKGVNKATPALFEVADTPQKMVDLGLDKLKTYVKSIGLYNAKSKNIIELSRILVEKFNSVVPDNFEDLTSLPGVGRKSANVLLSSLWGKERIAVDTHVFRISNRIGLAKAKNVLQTELQLYKSIPAEFMANANQWLVLHGRYVCKARKPECERCLINDLCDFYKKNGIK